jgi:hypothetical protein
MIVFAIVIATVVLVAWGTLWPAEMGTLVGIESGPAKIHDAKTPEDAVHNLFATAQRHDWKGAYKQIANTDQVDEATLQRDLGGAYDSLRTFSSLESVNTKVLDQSGDEARVRMSLKWASVVGAIWDTRDLKLVKRDDRWLIDWPAHKQAQVPPQVIPVNYLRWDVIYRSGDEDWGGAQDVDSPHVRIIAMNPVQRDGKVIVLGELVNEDTVPAYVNVRATLLDKDNNELGKENSFDKISHLVLPRQVTPFRIDFPGVDFSKVENIKMEPQSVLVAASADPVVVVQEQKVDKDNAKDPLLTGKLENQSGQIVNIPQVLATFYNKNGQIIWVNDGYVDHALLPKTPEAFALHVPPDIASQVADFRVMVNPYVEERLR